MIQMLYYQLHNLRGSNQPILLMQRCIVLRNGKDNDEQMRNHRDEQMMEKHKRRVYQTMRDLMKGTFDQSLQLGILGKFAL